MKRMLASLALGLGALSATAPALATSDYARTRYPIVFAHGLSGFANIGPIEYWHGIPADLNANGASTYVTQVSAFQSNEYRGEQLLQQVQEIMAISGAAKVNLLGHSQGAPTARYVAAMIPARVASVTTVGGVNKSGSPVADVILAASQLPVVGAIGTDLLTSLVNGFGAFIGLTAGQRLNQDSYAALTSLSSAGTAAFNAKFPAGIPATACGEGAYTANGIRNYSWSGTGVLTNPLDPLDAMFGLTSLAFVGKTDWQNDGLVGRCGSHFGQVIRDNYFMNHIDEVNLMFGLVSIFETNPKAVYRQHANRLKLAGL
ncbi:MAG: triacylglycerol lipase [Moraxellaceae bacterium]|nr:triacylglycerol lipase [Moraxellaceae bacterium]